MKHSARRFILFFTLSVFTLAANATDQKEDKYAANMAPLNDSGVWATVTMQKKGKTLTVSIEATGFEPGKPHPQHIHGHDNATNATCPGIEADANGDGVISVGEGLPDYGPILLPLVPFDLVDDAGNLSYEATFPINPQSLIPLHKRAVVLHGLTVDGEYVPSLPVACGEIERQ